jgi:hypothetical protein
MEMEGKENLNKANSSLLPNVSTRGEEMIDTDLLTSHSLWPWKLSCMSLKALAMAV